MAVDYLNLFADNNIPEHREERENGGHGRLPVYNEKRHMVDFESISKIPDSGSSFVGMGDDDDFMTAVSEFLRLMSVAFQNGRNQGVFLRSTIGKYDSRHHL